MKIDLEHEFAVDVLARWQIGPVQLVFTKTALFELIAASLAFGMLFFLARGASVVPTKRGVVAEALYLFVRRLVEGHARKEVLCWFPLLFSLFFYLLACNLIGLFPGSFAPNAQLAATAGMAAMVFVFVIALRAARYRWRFFAVFLPKGVPIWLAPLIAPIEMISFLARPITLAVRLFANMTAGHSALVVLAALGLAAPIWLAPLPAAFSVVQLLFEAAVCVVQAYIFTVLSCTYIDDAYELRH